MSFRPGRASLARFRSRFAPRLAASLLVLLVLAAAGPFGTVPAHGQSAPQTPAAAAVVPVPKDIGELKAIQARIEQVAAKLIPCTVVVRIGESQGSGVVVSKDGYVLSAGHVVGKPGQKATFIFADGKTLHGTTLGLDRDTDAGLLKITDSGQWPSVEMRKPGNVQPGTWCVTLGHPLGPQEGRPPVVRAGRVLQSRGTTFQTDCTIVAGDSGGPVVDLEGKVIGINSRINAPMPTMNFHVAIDAFHLSWDQMLKGDAVQAPGRDSNEVKGVFGPAVAEAGRCVVRVKCDGRDVALGTLVGPDGWIITKASQLKGKTVCRTADGQEREARLVGVHEGFDLAMLKINAGGLPLVPWAADAKPVVGQWVAVVGMGSDRPLAVGVVGVPLRKIPPIHGVLGIGLAEVEKPAQIIRIFPNSAAQKAGLQEKDIITHLNDNPTNTRSELQAGLRRFRPGTAVKLTVKRGDKTLQISATLSLLDTPGNRKRDMQNLAGPGVSTRHDDFPSVLQHDTVLAPNDCGGPLVDLSGRVVGLNIARGGRTETYSVPTDVVLGLMYDLMSGRLAPKPEAKPEPKPEPKTQPKPEPKPEPKPQGKPDAKPEPEPKPKPQVKPEPKPEPKPQVKPEPKPEPKPEAQPPAKPEAKPEQKPQAKPAAKPEAKPPEPAKPPAAQPAEPAKKPAP
jgi:serine protease Do